MNQAVLPASFYQRDTTLVAQELLGMRLCRRLPDGRLLSGLIVETEAYLGVDDPAAHSFGGRRTARTETMYAEGGVAYVYFIYGMHHCLNAVTRHRDQPEAVLIRALSPEHGHELWQEKFLRLKVAQWLSGPGRLCRAMQIDKSCDAMSLQSDELWIERAEVVPESERVAAARVGVDYAGEAALWPLRFYKRGDASVSRR
ncbi:MAG: DNA-3-methyladenine glycosylase [Pedobacter sp.]|nr:DNA-3-methyladenine glycosylase [Pedobacter sp.]